MSIWLLTSGGFTTLLYLFSMRTNERKPRNVLLFYFLLSFLLKGENCGCEFLFLTAFMHQFKFSSTNVACYIIATADNRLQITAVCLVEFMQQWVELADGRDFRIKKKFTLPCNLPPRQPGHITRLVGNWSKVLVGKPVQSAYQPCSVEVQHKSSSKIFLLVHFNPSFTFFKQVLFGSTLTKQVSEEPIPQNDSIEIKRKSKTFTISRDFHAMWEAHTAPGLERSATGNQDIHTYFFFLFKSQSYRGYRLLQMSCSG